MRYIKSFIVTISMPSYKGIKMEPTIKIALPSLAMGVNAWHLLPWDCIDKIQIVMPLMSKINHEHFIWFSLLESIKQIRLRKYFLK